MLPSRRLLETADGLTQRRKEDKKTRRQEDLQVGLTRSVTTCRALGLDRAQFGPSCVYPQTLELSVPELGGNVMADRVISLDHYGNVITTSPAAKVHPFLTGSRLATVQIDEQSPFTAPLVQTYGPSETGQVVCLVDSHGYWSWLASMETRRNS